MKNALRTHSMLVIALLCITLSACDNAADDSKNRLLSTGAKIGSGAVQGSIAEFTKAIKFDSTSAKAYAGRAAVKYATGDNKGAMTDLTKAIALDPKSATAYSARATAKFSGGDIPGAMADFISAAQIVVFSSSNKEPGN
ncbi:MAG: tetratricopeptide repeat protein [Chlorobium sp.]